MSLGPWEFVRRNRLHLVRTLILSEDLYSYLRQKRVLTEDLEETIKCEKKTSSQRGKLLDILPKRGEDAIEHFIEALIITEQEKLAKEINPSVTESILISKGINPDTLEKIQLYDKPEPAAASAAPIPTMSLSNNIDSWKHAVSAQTVEEDKNGVRTGTSRMVDLITTATDRINPRELLLFLTMMTTNFSTFDGILARHTDTTREELERIKRKFEPSYHKLGEILTGINYTTFILEIDVSKLPAEFSKLVEDISNYVKKKLDDDDFRDLAQLWVEQQPGQPIHTCTVVMKDVMLYNAETRNNALKWVKVALMLLMIEGSENRYISMKIIHDIPVFNMSRKVNVGMIDSCSRALTNIHRDALIDIVQRQQAQYISHPRDHRETSLY